MTQGGLFSVVGTPIGNLQDASPRMIQTLATSDVILCEDTRVSAKLLAAFDVHAPLVRADEHVLPERIENVLERLGVGEHVSFVSDAGMPGISDPGMVLVDAVLEAGFASEVVPGPSAVTCALVASGFAAQHFFFEGFLPRKASQRAERLAQLAAIPGALVLYESPKRVSATLTSLSEIYPTRRVALVRELTKLHEEVLRGYAADLLEKIVARGDLRGECVIVVEEPSQDDLSALVSTTPELTLEEALAQAIASGEKKSHSAKRLAQLYGISKQEVYDLLI